MLILLYIMYIQNGHARTRYNLPTVKEIGFSHGGELRLGVLDITRRGTPTKYILEVKLHPPRRIIEDREGNNCNTQHQADVEVITKIFLKD